MKTRLQKARSEARQIILGALVRLQPSVQHIAPNKLVFTAHQGYGYCCNPKYITEALLALPEAKQALDIVWLVNKPDSTIPSSVRQVRYGTLAAMRELATAKVWVDNARSRRHVTKKPGQFYLQTWHGAIGPKRLEADIESQLTAVYIQGAKADSRDADLFIANNDFYETILRNSFWYDGPILRCGMPRNAALLKPHALTGQKVHRALGIPEDKKICLYAPTFRDDGDISVYDFDYQGVCRALGEMFGGEYIFVAHTHPHAQARQLFAVKGAVDALAYNDVHELLYAADVLITDYSSIAEDFALLGRPGYQYVPDKDAYERTRGFYYPLEQRPFPLAHTQDQLLEAIRSTDVEAIQRDCKNFLEDIGMVDDGSGDAIIAQLLLDVIAQGLDASNADQADVASAQKAGA